MTVSAVIADGLELSARLRAGGQHEDARTVQRLVETVTSAGMRLSADQLESLPFCIVCEGRGTVATVVERGRVKVYQQCSRCLGSGRAEE